MATKQVQVSELQKGSYIVVDGAPCRVVDTQTSRPGKHGHAKIRLQAMGIIDNKKRDVVMPGHDNVDVPIIEKRTAQVLSIQGDKANVMDIESFETFDMDIPDELKESVANGVTVMYWDVMGTKMMKQIKGGD